MSDRSPALSGVRRVLVIGAAGLVGAHVRQAFGGADVVATHHRRPATGTIPLDITRSGEVRELVHRVRPDVIVLAAAEPYVERCERDPVGTRRVNVDGARHVAEAARSVGAALVVFSSEYVFDGTAGPYTEDRATCPINEYGRQKVELEDVARSVERHLICRTSGVFGWEAARKNFVCQLIDRAATGRRLEVPNDQLITPTFARSLAHAVRSLVESGHRGTFNTVGPRIVMRVEFAHMVARAFDLPRTTIYPRPTAELGTAARPANAGLSDARLRAAVGPLTTPEEALREMAAAWP